MPAGKQVTLRDGTAILVRPILPDDKDRLREGLARLSTQSRYRRFLRPLERLSDRQLRDLTEIDYADHMAWVAVDPSRPDQPGIGVARYIRVPDQLPATPTGRVFRSVASNELPPFRLRLPGHGR